MAQKQSGGKAVKAGIGYTVGNMLVKGITFLTIPLFTRLMSTESYGLFNTFNSYMAILTIFIGLALHASIKNAKYDFGDYGNQGRPAEIPQYLPQSMDERK